VKRSRLRPLYSKTTGADRFRLCLEAEARGDLAERDHLLASCPRFQVQMPDPDFLRMHEATTALTTELLLFLARYEERLRLLVALGELIPMAGVLLDEEGAPEPPGPGRILLQQVTADLLEDLMADAVRAMRSAQEAFARVCREGPRVDPKVVLSAFAPHVGELLAPYEALLEAAASVERITEHAYERMSRAWAAALGERLKED
jgi:hypothetical protein